MKWIIYFTISIVLIYYLLILNHSIKYKNTEWLPNSPTLIKISSNCAQFSFAVTKPATIYWRVYTNEITTIKSYDLTNTNSISNIFRFGGNTIINNQTQYTNMINNLSSDTKYYLYSIAVSYIGTFPKEIKSTNFKTLPNKN